MSLYLVVKKSLRYVALVICERTQATVRLQSTKFLCLTEARLHRPIIVCKNRLVLTQLFSFPTTYIDELK